MALALILVNRDFYVFHAASGGYSAMVTVCDVMKESDVVRTALVLEGGAMRGMYTAGVLDSFLEQEIEFDGIIGVSAGALFGVNYLSGQKGRAIRYNKRYNGDPSYMGIRPLLKTGNIVDTEYAYIRVPYELDPFDDEAFKASAVPFYAVITNLASGKAEYPEIKSVFSQMDTLRASGSMPFVSKPVRIGKELYLDGAVADSIPYQHMLDLGYDRLVVILTKDPGYVKKPIDPKLCSLLYKKKYPLFEEVLRNRHIMYNGQMEELRRLQEQGIAYIYQPSEQIHVSKTEKDPKKLEALYQVGRRDGLKIIF